MRKIFVLAIGSLALVACGAPKSKDADSAAAAEVADTASGVDGQRELTDRNVGHPELSPTQKVGGAEGRSPFEGDRVIMLNAIVRRSLDVSREFDTAAPSIRAAVDAAASGGDRGAADAGVKQLSDLYDRAKSALDDMIKAEAELKASGEYYDDSIFYGMQKFVADVETELREEKAALAAKLGG